MVNFDKNTVYILDSYGLIYRCYFAFINRPLTNKDGNNVSAIFGFFRNLHSILKHYNPQFIACAMDSKTATFRHEMYKEYKATRNKTPEDLHAQIPWIDEILTDLGIPVLQCDGYEADDIIATVAKKCAQQGKSCRILSGDKDLMQLVTETTQILKPDHADVWKVTGPQGVQAEWGVPPEQLLDLLSLYGDSADNIPGVQGVGVKTAGKLLEQYKNLDGIYEHIDEIKGAMQKKLIDGKENAYFSQKLIRLCDTVPCSDIDDAVNNPIQLNFEKAAQKLNQYGVPAVAKQYVELAVESGTSTNATTIIQTQSEDSQTEQVPSLEVKQNQGDYKVVTNLEELQNYINLIEENEKIVAFDCETTSLDTLNTQLVGFSLSSQAGKGIYVPLYTSNLFENLDFIPQDKALEQIARLFNNPQVTVILHNGKFDYKVLRSNGIKINNNKVSCKLVDTMIAEWLLNSDKTGKNSYSLEYLAETKLGLKGIEYEDLVPKGQTFADLPVEKAYPYAAEDADFTFQLWQKLEPQLKSQNLYELFTSTEMRLMPLLAEMEIQGIHLDSQTLYDYNKELTIGIEDIQNKIYSTVGHAFNIASPKQLQEVLFTERGLKPTKKTKTGYSTDTSVLEELALYDPVPKMILEYRELAKLQSTYVETLPTMCDKNERIHTDFIQTGTATGRLSCREPNLQNIPVRNEAGRKIRSAFTATPGTILISADYSQIELVVLAHLSQDKNMCNAFISGTDVHKATAALIFGVPQEEVTSQMRRTAKTINFGVIYGMSAFRLANDLGISRTQAAEFIENYFKTYSSVNDFINSTIQKTEETGFVQTIFGRKRHIANINSKNKLEKSGAERMAVNTPVQGSAADIVKKAMLDVSKALEEENTQAKLILQVHDELLVECPDNPQTIEKTISIIKEKMENAVKLNVPLKVSIEYGKNWGEFH
ncbi:MAG: DNA polymerase I [Treponema sp.]|nr:DNA polymerase I [Treponema sp.]